MSAALEAWKPCVVGCDSAIIDRRVESACVMSIHACRGLSNASHSPIQAQPVTHRDDQRQPLMMLVLLLPPRPRAQPRERRCHGLVALSRTLYVRLRLDAMMRYPMAALEAGCNPV